LTGGGYTYGEGVLEDLTYGSVDSFFVSAVCISTFTCNEKGYTIKLWPGASGWKYTGQSGQKQAHDGAWSGTAILYDPYSEPVDTFDVVGTWWSIYPHFNYNTEPDSYTAGWDVSYSSLGALYGEGGSEGDKQP